MFAYLVIILTVVPAIELVLLIKIGTHIGAGNTLTVIILTGVLGAHLARLQGFLVLRQIQDSLNAGIMPSAQLIDGIMILTGGILLLTPGFITDAVGFMLLIPLTRSILKVLLKRKLQNMIVRGHMTTNAPEGRHCGPYDDIDIN